MIFPLLVGYLSTPLEYLDLDQAVLHRKLCQKIVFDNMNINTNANS